MAEQEGKDREQEQKPAEQPKTEAPQAEEKTAAEKEEPKREGAPVEAPTKKRKKVNRMTLEEIEKKLKEVKERMGGITSRYACQLLKRKEQLTSS